MTTYLLPSLDKAAPIVDPVDGRPSVYFQRFWQNLKITAVDGANQNGSIAGLQSAVTTINGQITVLTSGKAPLASPTFTGDPRAPTPSPGDNDTSIATTAFVHVESVARATFLTWTAATGTAERTTFATYTSPTISASPTQAEVQAIADHVQILSRRLKALVDDLLT